MVNGKNPRQEREIQVIIGKLLVIKYERRATLNRLVISNKS